MAALIKCDKCGKTDNKCKQFKHIRGYKLTSPTSYRGTDTLNCFDVCNECYNDIFNIKEDNK